MKRIILITIFIAIIAVIVIIYNCLEVKSPSIVSYNNREIELYQSSEEAKEHSTKIRLKTPGFFRFSISGVTLSGDVYISGNPLPGKGLTYFEGHEKCETTKKNGTYSISKLILSEDTFIFSLPINGSECYFAITIK